MGRRRREGGQRNEEIRDVGRTDDEGLLPSVESILITVQFILFC